MSRNLKHLAVVIGLTGTMLDENLRAWSMLKDDFDISFISSHSREPHITISSGNCSTIDALKKAVTSSLENFAPFEIQGNGLGIFVKETPVLYIRWIITKELARLFSYYENALQTVWQSISKTTQSGMWTPKSTLAFCDISYKQLPGIIAELEGYDFEQTMTVDGITLLEVVEGEGEKFIERYRFHTRK